MALPHMMARTAVRAQIHTVLQAAKAAAGTWQSGSSTITTTSSVADTTRRAFSTGTRPILQAQASQSENRGKAPPDPTPTPTETSKSGGGDASAAHTDAAFDPKTTDPDQAEDRSQNNDTKDNPLKVSPSNRDANTTHDGDAEGRVVESNKPKQASNGKEDRNK